MFILNGKYTLSCFLHALRCPLPAWKEVVALPKCPELFRDGGSQALLPAGVRPDSQLPGKVTGLRSHPFLMPRIVIELSIFLKLVWFQFVLCLYTWLKIQANRCLDLKSCHSQHGERQLCIGTERPQSAFVTKLLTQQSQAPAVPTQSWWTLGRAAGCNVQQPSPPCPLQPHVEAAQWGFCFAGICLNTFSVGHWKEKTRKGRGGGERLGPLLFVGCLKFLLLLFFCCLFGLLFQCWGLNLGPCTV